jgi:hypothetical protein
VTHLNSSGSDNFLGNWISRPEIKAVYSFQFDVDAKALAEAKSPDLANMGFADIIPRKCSTNVMA